MPDIYVGLMFLLNLVWLFAKVWVWKRQFYKRIESDGLNSTSDRLWRPSICMIVYYFNRVVFDVDVAVYFGKS